MQNDTLVPKDFINIIIMAGLITIELKQLRFHAFHGLYAEEKKTGNEFEVSLAVSFESDEQIITSLDQSVNYARLYELISSEMRQQRDLLETFVMELAEKIHTDLPGVKNVEISIHKLHPPVARFTGSVGVKYSKGF
jgi:7,8-dihydroneopterin aldolase/epimerase/oxygenase